MSFYVSRWPDVCDPRGGAMGQEHLNGIQMPPAKIFFEEPEVAEEGSPWTHRSI